MTWETLLGLLKRPNLKEKETFRRPSRLEKVTIDNYRFRFLSFYFLLSGGKNFMFEITPFFPTKKPLFAKKFIGNFLLDPPTNTGVFPISGMIFIGEWRYPPTYFRDCFPIYVIFFFEGIPK